jgi:hypothetical protein
MSIMGKETNLNTILLAIAIGVLGWLTYETSETGKKVSAMTQAASTSDRELLDLRARVAKLEIEFAAFQARGNFR